MEPEVQNGAPAAESAAPAAPQQQQSSLSAQEQELLAQLPDFLVNTVSVDGMAAAAGFAPETAAPAETTAAPNEPAVDPASGTAADASVLPAAAPTEPDPVQLFVEGQNKFNQSLVEKMTELTQALKPAPVEPPKPQPKRIEDMTDEEAFIHLTQLNTQALVDQRVKEALKPFEDERNARLAAEAQAKKDAEYRAVANSIVAAAEGVVAQVVGADRFAKMTPEQRADVADEVMAAQAANAELRDAQGKIIGMNPAQAAAHVRARWVRLGLLPSAAPAPGVPTQQRAPVVPGQRMPGPGTVSPVPPLDVSGVPTNIPSAKEIHAKYGGSTDKILDAVFGNYSRVTK